MQALLVSLSHCGEILSFNPTAEAVTGIESSCRKEGKPGMLSFFSDSGSVSHAVA